MQVAARANSHVPRAATTASRWSSGRVLALLVLGNLLLGSLLFAVHSPWNRAAEVVVAPAMPAQVLELQARMAAGHHGEPYTLSLTDEELTAAAGAFLATGSNVPFTRVTVAVTGEKVIVNGVTSGLAVTVPVRAVGTLTADNGQPRAQIENVSLGDAPLPGFVREQVLRDANASLDFSHYNVPVTVEAVELRPGGMAVHGSLK